MTAWRATSPPGWRARRSPPDEKQGDGEDPSPVVLAGSAGVPGDGPVRGPGPTPLLPVEHPVGPAPLCGPFLRFGRPGFCYRTISLTNRAVMPLVGRNSALLRPRLAARTAPAPFLPPLPTKSTILRGPLFCEKRECAVHGGREKTGARKGCLRFLRMSSARGAVQAGDLEVVESTPSSFRCR